VTRKNPSLRQDTGLVRSGSVMENPVQTIAVTAAGAVLAWMASTLIEVDKRTAVIEVKVEENYKMLEPMWQDWLAGKQGAQSEQSKYEQAGEQAASETQVVQKTQSRCELQEAQRVFPARSLC